MRSWKRAPKTESVLKYVECYWFLEKEAHDHSQTNPKLNPDPSSHLIISNDNSVHQYDQEATSQVAQGSHWIFPHLKTYTMDHSSPFKIIGIKFRVGALYSLNLHKLSSGLDSVESTDINQLLGWDQCRVDKLMIDAPDQQKQVCNMLDDILSTWILTSYEDKHSDLVRQTLPFINDMPISDIGEKLHRSQRTIERSFMRVTQLTMKQCQSMIRLEEILNDLYQLDEKDIDWVHVATKYGFSDQPHLIRHLKSAIGSTPAEYAQKRDLTIDTYGDFKFN